MKNLILCAFGLLVITGCAKYDDTQAAKNLQVPPYTETGANTFGCLMNGSVWANFGAFVSQGGIFTHPTSPSKVNSSIFYLAPPADTLFVVGAQYSLVKNGIELREENMSIQLTKNGSLKGTHQLMGTNDIFRYDKTDLTFYTSKARNPFTVIINKDSVVNGGPQHIVSGRFYGVLYNYAQTDSVFISGGVFDTLTQ